MKVKDLIEMLQRCDALEADVLIFDGDSNQMEEVTGCLYGGSDNKVELLSSEE